MFRIAKCRKQRVKSTGNQKVLQTITVALIWVALGVTLLAHLWGANRGLEMTDEVSYLLIALDPWGTRGHAVFASRIKMLGFSVKRDLIRHYAGRVFATWVGICLDSRIYDSQCGLKFIPTHIFKKISSRLHGHGFAWDIELLAKLIAVGCPIREVPVNWSDIKGSKVNLLRDGLKLFWVALLEGWTKNYYGGRKKLQGT